MGLKLYFLIILLGAASASYDGSELATPGYDVLGVVDGHVILECQLVPSNVADDIETLWFRNPGPQIVHLYQMGQDQTQDSEYTQRTHLFKEQFAHGNMSLFITNLTVADEGEYHCSVKQFNKTLTSSLTLKIGAEGNQPTIKLREVSSENVKLECTSERWYPAPSVTWLDEHKNHLSPSNPPDFQCSAGGFFNVSSVIDLKATSDKKVTCVISNKLRHWEQFATLHLSDQFHSFIRNSARYTPWKITTIFFVIASVLIIGVVLILHLRKRKRLFGEIEQLKAAIRKMEYQIETLERELKEAKQERELKEAKQEDREPDDCNSSLLNKDKQHQDNTPM